MCRLVSHKALFTQSPTNMVGEYVILKATMLMAMELSNGHIGRTHIRIENI